MSWSEQSELEKPHQSNKKTVGEVSDWKFTEQPPLGWGSLKSRESFWKGGERKWNKMELLIS